MQRRFSLNLILGIAAVVCLGAILYWFDPSRAGFYPVCLLHRTTGLLCPGCGGLRAMHQLLHGHIAEAFRFNALLVLLMPVAAALALWWFVCRLKNQRCPFEFRLVWLWLGLALVLAFGIGRNLV